MTQDNDPWGNKPRNTEGSELGSLLNKMKESVLGKDTQNGGGKPPSNNFPNMPSFSGKLVVPVVGILALGWLSTGVYILPEGFHGVELTFGRYSETAIQPGFNFHKPYPIGTVDKVDIGSLKNLTVGSQNDNTEGQMLTSDENIVEVSLSVQYKIGQAEKYLFNVNLPEQVLKETLISSIREVVGSSTVDYVLTDGRAEWPAKVRKNLVQTLKGFDVGFDIQRVELRDAKAPAEVQQAFDDAVKAREDAERYKLQAQAYQNEQVPLARGKVKQILQRAQGDKESKIAKARGEATRFDAILKSYEIAPEVTRDRMYIETLQKVYASVNNVVVATGDNAPLLYLPVGQNTQQLPVIPKQPNTQEGHDQQAHDTGLPTTDNDDEADSVSTIKKTVKRLNR